MNFTMVYAFYAGGTSTSDRKELLGCVEVCVTDECDCEVRKRRRMHARVMRNGIEYYITITPCRDTPERVKMSIEAKVQRKITKLRNLRERTICELKISNPLFWESEIPLIDAAFNKRVEETRKFLTHGFSREKGFYYKGEENDS